MANDLAGTQTTIKEALDQLMLDKAASNHEDELQIWRLFIGLLHARAVANGVSIL